MSKNNLEQNQHPSLKQAIAEAEERIMQEITGVKQWVIGLFSGTLVLMGTLVGTCANMIFKLSQ